MSYKTVLVHVDHSIHAAQRIRIAAEIAAAEDAHLVGSTTDRAQPQELPLSLMSIFQAKPRAPRNEHASAALAKFDAIAAGTGVNSYERRVGGDEADGGISVQAGYCDLVVISQPDPEDPHDPAVDLPQIVMLNCARPVLIIPYAGHFEHIGKHVLVAWDGSLGATRAITSALPLLQRAGKVTVALFNRKSRSAVDGGQPGSDIALYMARHGVKVEVSPQHTDFDIGNALLSMAADIDCDMIVMGGYGHTRLREFMAGGVTDTVLKTMTVPVFMVH